MGYRVLGSMSVQTAPLPHDHKGRFGGRDGENQFESGLVSSKISLTLQPSKAPADASTGVCCRPAMGRGTGRGQGLHLKGSPLHAPHHSHRNRGLCSAAGTHPEQRSAPLQPCPVPPSTTGKATKPEGRGPGDGQCVLTLDLE